MIELASDIFFLSWYVVIASGVVFVAIYLWTVGYLKEKDIEEWRSRRLSYGAGFALIGSVVKGDGDGDGADPVLAERRVLLKRALTVFTVAFIVFVICFPLVFIDSLVTIG